MIYTSAIYADPDHTQVTGTDAKGATETVATEHKVFRQPEHGPSGFLAGGGAITPYEAPGRADAPSGAALDDAAASASAGDFKGAFKKLMEII